MHDILNILVLRLNCLHRGKNNNKKSKKKYLQDVIIRKITFSIIHRHAGTYKLGFG